jgi:hypothetical protein
MGNAPHEATKTAYTQLPADADPTHHMSHLQQLLALLLLPLLLPPPALPATPQVNKTACRQC